MIRKVVKNMLDALFVRACVRVALLHMTYITDIFWLRLLIQQCYNVTGR